MKVYELLGQKCCPVLNEIDRRGFLAGMSAAIAGVSEKAKAQTYPGMTQGEATHFNRTRVKMFVDELEAGAFAIEDCNKLASKWAK